MIMYIDEISKMEDENRLYEQLMTDVEKFCMDLNWLSEKALASDAPDRFKQMWDVYYEVMTRVGRELFGNNVYWKTKPELIEEPLTKILSDGYERKILELILGAKNLLVLTQPERSSHINRLHEISMQYYGVTRQYFHTDVLNADMAVKWDYIETVNHFFDAAYDIVAMQCLPVRETPREKIRERNQRDLEEKFDEIFGDLDHSFGHKVKRFFGKIFSKRRR